MSILHMLQDFGQGTHHRNVLMFHDLLPDLYPCIHPLPSSHPHPSPIPHLTPLPYTPAHPLYPYTPSLIPHPSQPGLGTKSGWSNLE